MKITIYNDWDHIPKYTAENKHEVILAWNGEYRKGDFIEFSDLTPGRFYVIKADAAIETAFVYVKANIITFEVPFYEKKAAYNPISFWGCRHLISIREAWEWEINGYRNLACNPLDQNGMAGVYPHAFANSDDWGQSVFHPRNAIDGIIAPRGHGEWPHESWGINGRSDAAFTLDFGRLVDVDEIWMYTRADFPHDNWWKEIVITFSDGTSQNVTLEKKQDEPHKLVQINKQIQWLRLEQLIMSDEPARFPALSEIQVFGRESEVID